MENKKIKNASPIDKDGIHFKSKLEYRFYNLLKEEGYNPGYEKDTFIIQPGFYPTLPCYDVHYNHKIKAREFGLSSSKVRPITYTPDFTLSIGDILFVMEIKGKENDVFPVKKKIFRKWMEDYYHSTGQKIVYFEIFNKKQMLESIRIIKEYEEQFIVNNKELNK